MASGRPPGARLGDGENAKNPTNNIGRVGLAAVFLRQRPGAIAALVGRDGPWRVKREVSADCGPSREALSLWSGSQSQVWTMSEPASSRPAPADASVMSEDAATSVLSAAARSWPGAALAIGAGGRILSASPLSGFLEGMRAPFDLPVAPIASQIVDAAGRRWRISAPVSGIRLAIADLKEEPEAAHRFTAAVSHEIRTPLNGILGMAALLEEGELSAAQRDYATAIRRSGARLLDLLNNVLDFSRMEAGDIPLDAAPFDPADLVQDVAELLAPRAHGAGLDIAAIVDPDLPVRMIGDAGRLRQILFNLAGNAIKFTEKGSVLIEARRGEGGAGMMLIVRDTGIGVPDHARARLFDAFSQVSAADARRDGGVGLGLAIVARLVAAMKGAVDVSSTYGQGAMFRVSLPLEAGKGPAGQTRRHRRRTLKVTMSLPPASGLAIVAALAAENAVLVAEAEFADVAILDAALPPAQIEAMAKRTRTLVVLRPGDRSRIEQFRELGCAGYLIRPLRASSIVERVGLTLVGMEQAELPSEEKKPGEAGLVLIADDSTGAEALERIGENDYAVVFMDIRMPVMDGLEATRRVRRLAGPVSQTPIVALTADVDRELEDKAREAGVSQLAAKPIDPPRLRELAAQWAREHKRAGE
jgi:signal transduction histidine kinase/CheY-like chemotaxis protein